MVRVFSVWTIQVIKIEYIFIFILLFYYIFIYVLSYTSLQLFNYYFISLQSLFESEFNFFINYFIKYEMFSVWRLNIIHSQHPNSTHLLCHVVLFSYLLLYLIKHGCGTSSDRACPHVRFDLTAWWILYEYFLHMANHQRFMLNVKHSSSCPAGNVPCGVFYYLTALCNNSKDALKLE